MHYLSLRLPREQGKKTSGPMLQLRRPKSTNIWLGDRTWTLNFQILDFILFSRFWIIFIIIILNSFSGRFPISSSFVWLGGLFACSFTCWVFLCLFILFRLLCLGWPFCILVVCGSFLLWRFLPVGGVGRLACQGFLVRVASVFWRVEVGGGFRMGNTCKSMADSCQYMAKTTTIL